MEEFRKKNREALFGGAEKRRKRLSDFQKKADAAAKKRKADKAAKKKKLVESQKAINKKIRDKNKKRGRMIPKALSREERKKRLSDFQDKLNKARGKKTTPKKPSKLTGPKQKGTIIKGKKAPPATDKGGRSAVPGTMRGKQVDTKMGPNMSKVTKVTAADRKKQKGGADNRSTMQKLFGASEEKRKMGRDMQRKAQASMGFNKGGSLKTPTNPGLKKLPTEVRNKMGFMNKGGKVKKMKSGGKCKIDGIAIRGRTRARTK